MKQLGWRQMVIMIVTVLANMFVWQDRNPVGVACFCAAFLIIEGKLLLVTAALLGMAYALSTAAFIKYAGLTVVLSCVMIVMKKLLTKYGGQVHLLIRLTGVLLVLAQLSANLGYDMAIHQGELWPTVQTLKMLLVDSIIAGIIFTLIMGIYHLNRDRVLPKKKNIQREQELLATKNQLYAFSESFRTLSKSFEKEANIRTELNQNEMQQIFENLTERVCRDCSRCSFCWEQFFEDSCQHAFAMMTRCEAEADLQKKDLPKQFRQRCLRMDVFLQELKQLVEMAKVNLSWQNRLAESRLVVAGQFGEVASIIGNFTEQMGEDIIDTGNQEADLIKILNKRHLKIRRLAVTQKKNGRCHICMEMKVRQAEEIASECVARLISDVYGRSFMPISGMPGVIGKQWTFFSFEEDVCYQALTGKARMIRMGEKISGDSFTILQSDQGQQILSISDGMGSGERAEMESNQIITLLEQLMLTGFTQTAAIRLIHAVTFSGAKSQACSTLDLGIIDLYDGKTEILKMGAATSFIKRGKQVEQIYGHSLPVGAMPKSDMTSHHVKMSEGDLLIMMSDGVLMALSAVEQEKEMADFMATQEIDSPQELANAILNHAMVCSHYEAEDDMTVLVCGLYKKAACS